MDTLPERLRHAMQASRRDAAQVAHLAGISAQSVYNLTSGTTKPETVRAQTLFNLAGALKCDAEWLLTGKNSGTQSGTASHLLRVDRAILHEALTLLMYDEDETVGGGEYSERERTERLAELYEWVAQDGGRLTAANNARFMDQVTARRQARGSTADGRRTLREAG
jgi:transcriptional regulator with XRE-family HTH domain